MWKRLNCYFWCKRKINPQRAKSIGTQTLEEYKTSCCICLEKFPDIVLNPCNHLCLCQDCSRQHQLKTCPICKTNIHQKIQVYI